MRVAAFTLGMPQATSGFIVLWLFSAAVSALKPPDERSREAYTWLYRFLHFLAANLDRAGIIMTSTRDGSNMPANRDFTAAK